MTTKKAIQKEGKGHCLWTGSYEPDLQTNLTGIGKHPCIQCGKDMGFSYLLGDTCLKCCKANHRRIMGK